MSGFFGGNKENEAQPSGPHRLMIILKYSVSKIRGDNSTLGSSQDGRKLFAIDGVSYEECEEKMKKIVDFINTL